MRFCKPSLAAPESCCWRPWRRSSGPTSLPRHTWWSPLAIRVGEVGLTLTLREWVNSGLMTFFFFVVGLEARREFDLGELRQRRRVALPVLAGLRRHDRRS